jgi:hypothetical protein
MSALIPPPTVAGESRQLAVAGCCVPPAPDVDTDRNHSYYPVKLLRRGQIEHLNAGRLRAQIGRRCARDMPRIYLLAA